MFVALLVVVVLAAGLPAAAEETDEHWSPPLDARERVERILEDPVFQLEEPEPGAFDKIMAEVREFIFRLFSRVSSVIAKNAGFVQVLLWVVIAAALLGAGWLIIRLTRDRLGTRLPHAPSIYNRGTPVARGRSPQELLAEAQKAFLAGQGLDGLGLCLAASTLALRSAGYLPRDRAMTALEGARLLERSGPVNLQAPFRSLVASHDRLVYAGGQPASGELDQALHLADGIVQTDAESETTG